MKQTISALVLTKDEEEMIEDALSQLDFANEIIILDQNSQDNTLKIAKKFTSKIFNTNLEDYSKRRNLLMSYAKGNWILYLDPDERLTKAGIAEIKEKIMSDDFSAYYLPRKNFILGKFQKHGGWYPDYVPRLFKKDKLKLWHGEVHESPQIEGTFGYLKEPIEHKTARNMKSMLAKSIKWAKVEAQLYYNSNSSKVNILKVLKSAFLEFTKRYFVKFGFLDGKIGLICAIYQSLHQVMVLVYLWEIQNDAYGAFKKIQHE